MKTLRYMTCYQDVNYKPVTCVTHAKHDIRFLCFPLFSGSIILFDETLMWDTYFVFFLGITTFVAILLTFKLFQYFAFISITSATLKGCLRFMPDFGMVLAFLIAAFAALGSLGFSDAGWAFRYICFQFLLTHN